MSRARFFKFTIDSDPHTKYLNVETIVSVLQNGGYVDIKTVDGETHKLANAKVDDVMIKIKETPYIPG